MMKFKRGDLICCHLMGFANPDEFYYSTALVVYVDFYRTNVMTLLYCDGYVETREFNILVWNLIRSIDDCA